MPRYSNRRQRLQTVINRLANESRTAKRTLKRADAAFQKARGEYYALDAAASWQKTEKELKEYRLRMKCAHARLYQAARHCRELWRHLSRTIDALERLKETGRKRPTGACR